MSLYEEGHLGTDGGAEERWPCEGGGGVWSDTCHQPTDAWGSQKLEEAKKDLSLETSEGAGPLDSLILDLSLHNGESIHSCCFRPLVSGALVRQPKEVKTASYAEWMVRGHPRGAGDTAPGAPTARATRVART